jgi:predicted nucleotidyltransferase
MARIPQSGAQQKLQRYIGTLRLELPILQTKYQVCYLGIFGSYVQGTSRKNSDLDVLVEFSQAPSLFEFLQLESDLSALLGVKVDLVMKSTLKPLIGQHILSEVVSL